MSTKQFSERLNKELDELGVPELHADRVAVFAKLMHIPKLKAEFVLDGKALPDQTLLDTIASELEIDPKWLMREDDK